MTVFKIILQFSILAYFNMLFSFHFALSLKNNQLQGIIETQYADTFKESKLCLSNSLKAYNKQRSIHKSILSYNQLKLF